MCARFLAYYIGDDSCEEEGLFLLVRGFLLGKWVSPFFYLVGMMLYTIANVDGVF